MTHTSVFRRYLLPGFLFQSVVIAGGYGTGRELVEFFLTQGPLGGLLGILVTTLIFSAVSMATFELARLWQAFNYRHFFQKLLGRGWWLFEVCYVGLLLIVLAVVAAASGEIVRDTFGLNYWIGVAAVMISVGALVFGGNETIERFFTAWSFVLYSLYIVFFVWCFQRLGGDISANLFAEPAGSGWAWAGLRYAGYNLAVIPPVLAAMRLHTTRKETFIAGALTGPIAMIPGLLFFLPMVGLWPVILDAPVPSTVLLEMLGSRAFQIAFQLVLFGTLIETGAGLIHAFNERILGLRVDSGATLEPWVRPTIAVVLLGLGTAISSFGLVGLIARGYGTLTIGFILVYVIPVLTIGVWRIKKSAG
ncbi:MAG: hypothetical protein O2958_07220 [Gemmatimonadetes bacterium]|nr:hypothetical protein [Gemmatimonadota bacterium]MDA1103844.1 hypothetical protein [Gemmatimonadota bacterium]